MLLVDQEGPIRRLTLNRPEVRNAFNDELIAALGKAIEAAGDDPQTRFLLLAGAGKVFCAGADLNWMEKAAGYSAQQNREDALRLAALFSSITRCPKPVIARVHGAALGGATGLIAACDVVVAEEGTVFGFSEIKLGILPAVISPFVVRRIGAVHARHRFLTGDRFGAEEALRISLIDRLAARGELDETIRILTKELLTSAPAAMRAVGDLVDLALRVGSEGGQEELADMIAELRAGAEGREGMRAFLERRRANWVPD